MLTHSFPFFRQSHKRSPTPTPTSSTVSSVLDFYQDPSTTSSPNSNYAPSRVSPISASLDSKVSLQWKTTILTIPSQTLLRSESADSQLNQNVNSILNSVEIPKNTINSNSAVKAMTSTTNFSTDFNEASQSNLVSSKFEFPGTGKDELGFKVHEIIRVISKADVGWWYGESLSNVRNLFNSYPIPILISVKSKSLFGRKNKGGNSLIKLIFFLSLRNCIRTRELDGFQRDLCHPSLSTMNVNRPIPFSLMVPSKFFLKPLLKPLSKSWSRP